MLFLCILTSNCECFLLVVKFVENWAHTTPSPKLDFLRTIQKVCIFHSFIALVRKTLFSVHGFCILYFVKQCIQLYSMLLENILNKSNCVNRTTTTLSVILSEEATLFRCLASLLAFGICSMFHSLYTVHCHSFNSQ